jgi:hypothetical protein
MGIEHGTPGSLIQTKGFFAECGVLDGEFYSNTVDLKKRLNWTGVGENRAVRVVCMLALSILRYVLIKSKCRKNSCFCNPRISMLKKKILKKVQRV